MATRPAPPVWDRLNVDALLTQFIAWLPSLFSAIIIFFVFWGILRVTRPALAHILSRGGFDPALASMLLNVYRLVVLTFGIIMGSQSTRVSMWPPRWRGSAS